VTKKDLRMKGGSIEDIQRVLREHIADLSKKYGIHSIELFGSYEAVARS